MKINELVGKTLINVLVKHDEIIFTDSEGNKYKLYHEQDCCENVSLEDVNGDWNDLIRTPILLAEEFSNEDFIKNFEESFKLEDGEDDHSWNYKNETRRKPESYTYTFYKLATIKGYVDIRYFGESNGYYSERVNFVKI